MARLLQFNKLEQDGSEGLYKIEEDAEVYYRNRPMWYVRYNDILVWKKDTSGDVPLDLSATKNQWKKIAVTWGPPRQADGTPIVVSHYKLYRDGALYKSTVYNNYFEDLGLADGESHEYCVTAVFNTTNESNCSNTDMGITRTVSGSQTFTRNGKFTVPNGVTQVKVCVQAGGNGGFARTSGYSAAGGGKSGEIKEEIISVTPGQRFTVKVGEGGRRSGCWVQDPGQGGRSTFGSVISRPGKFKYYYGVGGIKSGDICGTTYQRDGNKARHSNGGYGGEGTIFGRGGEGGYSFESPMQSTMGTGYGTGGGGQWNGNSGRRYSAAGYQGVVVVTWGINMLNPVSMNEVSEALGYDVLDPNFLNIRRYTNTKINELPLTNQSQNVRVNIDSDDFSFDMFDETKVKGLNDDSYRKTFL